MTKIQHFYFTNRGVDLGCWVFANTDKAYFYCLEVKKRLNSRSGCL